MSSAQPGEREVLAELPLEPSAFERRSGWGGVTLRVPVRAEVITLERETVVAEEVEVRTEQVEEVARVEGTIRREELDVDFKGDLESTRPLSRP